MDIAIDVRSLMEGRHSGVEEYTVQIIRALLRVGPEHTYHLFYNAARPVGLPDFSGDIHIHGFRYPNKLFNLSQLVWHWPRWDSLVKADVFFIPSFRLVPLLAKTPLVTTVHDLSFERFPEFWDYRRRVWHAMMRPRQLMQASDHLITVSEHTAYDLQELYRISPEKISVIHSGIETKIVPGKDEQARVRKKYELPERFLLYFGTLEPRKNIAGIIRAFSAIGEDIPQHLVIAGARGWRTKDIDEAVKEASPYIGAQIHPSTRINSVRDSASQNVRLHFPGFIAEEDKAALYAAADLFIYPSFYEGFGFPPLEALLNGTPVITSFNSSLPEVVGEWATLINPYDVGELALVIKELGNDLPTVSEETRHVIQEKYSWDQAAQKTIDVIEKVL